MGFHAKNLKCLDLEGQSLFFTAEGILKLATSYHRLKSLNCLHLPRVCFTDKQFLQLIKCQPELEHLSANQLQHVTAAAFEEIPMYCPALKKLELGNPTPTKYSGQEPLESNLNDSILSEIVQRLPELQHLGIWNCETSVDGSFLKDAACPGLSSIEFFGCKSLSAKAWKDFNNKSMQLKELSFVNCQISDNEEGGAYDLLAANQDSLEALRFVDTAAPLSDKELQSLLLPNLTMMAFSINRTFIRLQ